MCADEKKPSRYDMTKVRIPRQLPEPTPRVLLRMLKPEEVTEGGIILPDIARDQRLAGVIEVLGEGIPDNWNVRKGSIVQIGAFAKNDITELGEDMALISANDILVVLSEPEN